MKTKKQTPKWTPETVEVVALVVSVWCFVMEVAGMMLNGDGLDHSPIFPTLSTSE